jgi:hypothetical protein
MRATTVAHQGIFENAFDDEWTEPEPESQAHSAIIYHVIKVYYLSADSVVVKYIEQQQTIVVGIGSCCLHQVRGSQRICHCES